MLQGPVISGTALAGMLRIYSVGKEEGKENVLWPICIFLLVHTLAFLGLEMEIHIPSKESAGWTHRKWRRVQPLGEARVWSLGTHKLPPSQPYHKNRKVHAIPSDFFTRDYNVNLIIFP